MEHKHTVHIAIVDMLTIKKIVLGTKTIESRFSKNRIKPYGMVNADDLVLLKGSGSGIFGYFFVDHAETLANFDILEVKEQYNDKIAADEDFWNRKVDARYASLMYCKEPAMAESGIFFKRTGMDGWMILPQNSEQQVICFSGQICSGKTGYAKRVAEILNARYIHFETILKKYAAEHGFGGDRTAVQDAGRHIMNTMGSIGLMKLVMHELEGIPSSCHIVFDGIRQMEVYCKIKSLFHCTKLIYVESKPQERYQRYIKRGQHDITYQEFISINNMPVEQSIPALKAEADYVIKSMPEKDLDAAINVTAHMISSILTGQTYQSREIA